MQLELRLDGIFRIVVLSLISQSHRVHQTELVATELVAHGWKHVVVVRQVIAVRILFTHRQVWHLLIGSAQEVASVSLVLRVGHVEVRHHLDTVAHKIVESHTRRETVQALLKHRTRLRVPTTRHTEVGFLTTTRNRHVVLLQQTVLDHFLPPVGVVVIHFIFRERRVVVEFHDVARCIRKQRIVVSLLHQHRILVTIQHAHTCRLVSQRRAVGIAHTSLTTLTTLRLDFNHTISTLRTPNGSTRCILQHRDGSNIVGVHIQQLRPLVLTRIRIVEVVVVVRLEDITIHHNQRVGITIDGAHTTQAHLRTRTEVTRSGNDVETCDTALQCLVNGRHTQSLEFLRIDRLVSDGKLTLRNGKTTRLHHLLRLNHHVGQLRATAHADFVGRSLDRNSLSDITNIGDTKSVLRIHDFEGEITIDIRHGMRHDTLLLVYLHHVCHHQRFYVILHSSVNHRSCCLRESIHASASKQCDK